jgi:hypothetical protein
MTETDIQTPAVKADPEDPLQRLILASGVRPDQPVCVAGPASLDMLAALCRAGFERVECARQATCAGADEVSDLLILTGPPQAFGGLCARTAPLLRNGGVIVARMDRLEEDASLRAALLVHNFEISTSTVFLEDGVAVVHRVWRRAALARAS